MQNAPRLPQGHKENVEERVDLSS